MICLCSIGSRLFVIGIDAFKEGRNQEHLTVNETEQLEEFVLQLEHSISVHWYGVHENDSEDEEETPRKSEYHDGGSCCHVVSFLTQYVHLAQCSASPSWSNTNRPTFSRISTRVTGAVTKSIVP